MSNTPWFRPQRVADAAVFAAGFRVFFLLAGGFATAASALWLGSYAGWVAARPSWPALWWHGHEMVFGFGTAAVTGFLLTAVPSWTDSQRLSGAPVLGLAFAWVAGRVALLSATSPWLAAVLDLGFLPLLILAITRPMLRGGRAKNFFFPLLLGTMWLGNGLCHLDALGLAPGEMRRGLAIGTYGLIGMIAILTGRIIPGFTHNTLRRLGRPFEIRSYQPLEWAAKIVLFLALAADVIGLDERVQGGAALLASALFAARMWGWRTLQILDQPIVWILHAGHAFLVLGLLCKGIGDLTPVFPGATAFHAFTAGTIGTTVLGVMTRAGLGHTGRPLVLPRAIVLAYLLVMLGALARIFGPVVVGEFYSGWMLWAGVSWAAGYGIFTCVYFPILIAPRRDGAPG